MVSEQTDPWGSAALKLNTSEDSESNHFKDNFTANCLPPTGNSGQYHDKKIVVLDDSEEYLNRLEKKLKKITTISDKNTNSRSLLASLSARRQTNNMNLLNKNSSIDCSATEIEDASELPRSRGILLDDKQSHLNNLIQRVVPGKSALSAEELIQLLTADSLSASVNKNMSEQNIDENESSINEDLASNTESLFISDIHENISNDSEQNEY